MSRIKILGIAPFESLRIAMEQIGKSYPEVELNCFTGDMQEAVEILHENSHTNYDCIISRGGTARLLEKETEVPIAEIHTSVYDVLRAIQLADNYKESYAIVGFGNITEPAHTICNLLGKDAQIITIEKPDQVSSALRRLEENGTHTVICDKITHTVALQLGFNALLIGSGAESLHASFRQAIKYAKIFTPFRNETLFLKEIASTHNGQVFVLDENGAIYYSLHATTTDSLIPVLRTYMNEVPHNSSATFYHTQNKQFYRITANIVQNNEEDYYLFYVTPSSIPTHVQHSGIRYLSKNECEFLVESSFYSISGAMGTLDRQIDQLAASLQPVMIRGETGTGKEQVARYLYIHGNMPTRPFVSINCETISDKTWDYVMNHYGSPLSDSALTVYFQGMEHLSQAQISQLLATIRETNASKRIRLLFSFAIPDHETVPAWVQDFSTKVGCMMVHLPSLKNRKDEISFLASLYLNNLNMEQGKNITGFGTNVMNLLRDYDWPNNYTQFKNVLEKLVTLTSTSYIQMDTVAEVLEQERALYASPSVDTAIFSGNMTLDDIIALAIQERLKENNGNKAATARDLGISRTTLWRYLDKES